MIVNRTERGWAGHFICAHDCLYRRNTLLEWGDISIVVSSVGNMHREGGHIETIGAFGRYYETMAFMGKESGPYIDADVHRQVSFDAKWSICAQSPSDLTDDVDNQADQMHEAVVREIAARMESGEFSSSVEAA